MNVFYLDTHPRMAATYHNNKHVVKMVLETAQILSTTNRILGIEHELFYKQTHVNHPSVKWARESKANYKWLHDLLKALCEEYTYRYGKVHKVESSGLVKALESVPGKLPDRKFTQPPLTMPEEYKTSDSCLSYRKYYIGEKRNMANWTGPKGHNPIPYWYT